jgi:hypothetical protein
MSTVFRKPAIRVPPQPLTRPKSQQWLRSVLSSTVWQRERFDLPDRYLAIPLIVAVAGFLAVCVYSVARDLGSMHDGRRVSALVCQYVERGGQGIGSCQERR